MNLPNYNFRFIFCFLVTILSISFQTSCNSINHGLTAHYELKDNVNDLSKNQNDGISLGAKPSKNSEVGFDFNGVRDHILVNDNAALDFEDFSISVWIKTTQKTDDHNGRCIIDKYPQYGKPWSLRLGPEGNIRFICDQSIYGKTIVNDGKWHHIATTKKGATTKLFIDGVFEVEGTSTTSSTNNFDMTIGKQNSNFLRNFSGIIYDVRIYKKSISEKTIKKLSELVVLNFSKNS